MIFFSWAKQLLLFSILFFASHFAASSILSAQIELIAETVDLTKHLQQIPIKIDHATSKKEIEWGLMERRELEENAGLLFHFTDLRKRTFWSFNCWINLSVAFLDADSVVQEVQPLHAFPHIMQMLPPIESIEQLHKQKIEATTRQFFHAHAAVSRLPSKFVLEVNIGWFDQHHIAPGDRLCWQNEQEAAYFTRAIDLASWQKTLSSPLLFLLPTIVARPTLRSTSRSECQIVELDETQTVLKISALPAEGSILPKGKTTQFILASNEWIRQHPQLQKGSCLATSNR